MNKKSQAKIVYGITFLLIFTLVFSLMFVFAGTLEEQPITTYTPSTDTTCKDGGCNLILYSGIRNVYEDGNWTRIENARSLKDKGFNIVYLENDPDFNVIVNDFNISYIDMDLEFLGDPNDYPDFCQVTDFLNAKCDFKLDEKWNEINETTGEVIEKNQIKFQYKWEMKHGEVIKGDKVKFEYKGNPFGRSFKFGGNSTTIILQEADTENIGDTQVYIAFPNTNYGDSGGMFIGTFFGQRYYGMVEFSMLSVPRGKVMVNSSLHLRGINSVVDNIIQVYEYSYFNESYLTYNNYPANGSFIGEALNVGDDWVHIDVTSWVSTCYSDNKNNCSFFLHNPTGSNPQFATKEHATTAYRPYLNITYTDDATPPNLTLDYPQNNSYYNSNLSIALNYSVSDDTAVDTVWYYILNSTDGYEISNTTLIANITFNISSEGNYTIYLYANDTSNNINSTSAFFVVDLTTPRLLIISPTDGYTVYDYVSGSVPIFTNFSLTETNPDSCWHTIDGGITNTSISCSSGYNNFTFSLSAVGTFTLEIYANDTSGNENSTSIQIIMSAYTGPQTGGGATTDPSENIIVDFNLYNRTIMCREVNKFLELRTENYTTDQRESLKNSLDILFGFGIIDSVLGEYLENFEEHCPEYCDIPDEPGEVIDEDSEEGIPLYIWIFIAIVVAIILIMIISLKRNDVNLVVHHKDDAK